MLMDLSLQGCQIKGAALFESGTRLRLQLWLPDQARPVKVEQAAVLPVAGGTHVHPTALTHRRNLAPLTTESCTKVIRI